MARQGDELWYYDQGTTAHLIARTDTSGHRGPYFWPGDKTVRDLAWDGSYVWAVNDTGLIRQFSPSGIIWRSISGLLQGGWGLACGEKCLWVSDPRTDTIYRISLDYQVVGGDVNGDGGVNVLDVLAVINHILSLQILEGEALGRADFNRDGTINVLDALGIVNIILGIGRCESAKLPASLNCEPKSRSNRN